MDDVTGGQFDSFCKIARVQVDFVFVEVAEVDSHFQDVYL